MTNRAAHPRRVVAGAAAMALSVTGVPARADECRPLRMAASVEALPVAWQEAALALAEATSHEGLPWSCVGGEASLVLDEDEGGATLRLETPALRAVERHVGTPDDVVPTGKALLAATLPAAPARAASEVAADAPTAPAPPAGAAPVPRHRSGLLVDASIGTGYIGPTRALWGGGTLRGALRYEPWFGGVWARVDAPYHYVSPVPDELAMSEVSIGLTAAREIVRSPLVLYVALQPSIAVVSMEGERPPVSAAGEERRTPEGSKVDLRVGAGVGIWVPLSGMWRAVLSLDGELAPAGFGEDAARRIDAALPLPTAYSLGLSFGVGMTL